VRNARQAVTPARNGTIQQTGRALRDEATETLAAKKPNRRTISAGIDPSREGSMDILERRSWVWRRRALRSWSP
jgi:hypothetical protein